MKNLFARLTPTCAWAARAKPWSFLSCFARPLALARGMVGIAMLAASGAFAQYTVTDLGNLGLPSAEQTATEA